MRRALLLSLLMAAACARKAPSVPAPREPAGKGVELSQPNGNVRPVYPVQVKPDALAQRLCDALTGLPERRRGECCAAPAEGGLTSECVRMVSAALQARTIAITPAAIDACQAAMAALHQGCEWVGPWTPAAPPACLGVVQGRLGEGASCRSSLECQPGQRCHGVGPTSAGVCGAPLPEGEFCTRAPDPLATYTRQDDLDRAHPECLGTCYRGRCVSGVALGAECAFSEACGAGRHCADGKCVAGAYAALGAPCSSGGCEPGARCHGGRCVLPKAAGEACAADPECRGACVTAAGGQKVCKSDCSRR